MANVPTTAPDPIHLTGQLIDVTDATQPVPVGNTQVRVIADGGGDLATTTADGTGNFTVDVASGGQPLRAHLAADAVGYVPNRQYTSIPLDSAFIQRGGMVLTKQSRLDALATGLGATLDASKGSLEVCIADCALQPFPGAHLSVSGEPQLAWAMFAGSGTWIARDTTVSNPTGWVCTIAGAVNLSPGSHTVTITSGDVVLGPFAFEIEAGVRSEVVVWPGRPIRF